MKFVFNALVSFVVLIYALPSLSANVLPYFERLKDSAVQYEIIGVVCEQVLRLNLEDKFPGPKFYLATGIQYGNNTKVVGELDVIVFDSASKNAIYVGEVKCWDDMPGGLLKAQQQRDRFFANLQQDKVQFMIDGHNKHYDSKAFKNLTQFVPISQKGGLAIGYEEELQFTLEELMQLRKMMIDCQKRGECAEPVTAH